MTFTFSWIIIFFRNSILHTTFYRFRPLSYSLIIHLICFNLLFFAIQILHTFFQLYYTRFCIKGLMPICSINWALTIINLWYSDLMKTKLMDLIEVIYFVDLLFVAGLLKLAQTCSFVIVLSNYSLLDLLYFVDLLNFVGKVDFLFD